MSKLLWVVLIIIASYFIFEYFADSNPYDPLVDKAKSLFNDGNSSQEFFGKPFTYFDCKEDKDCTSIADCSIDCLCDRPTGACYQVVTN